MKKIEFLINSMEPNMPALFGFASLQMLNGILIPTFVSILALSSLRNWSDNSHNPMINPYRIDPGSSEQIFIETMRSWGKSIWWCFFFILPGIYKFLSYAYVPIVVFLNPNYQMGTVDALKSSEQQFRKKPWSTIVIFLIFYLVIPIMLSSFLDSYKDFNKTPGPALLVSSVTGFLNLMALLLLAEVYLKDSGLDALKEN